MKKDVDSIKEKAFFSIIWKFMERFIAQGITLVVTIIIARILSPDDYSVVSLVTIFFGFANVIISGGLNTAIIQKKDADIDDYSTLLYISVLLSVAVYGIFYVCAPMIEKFYDQDMLIPIIRVMGLVLPVYAVKSIVYSYISSNLLFKKFFFATLGGSILSGVVGIWMAIKGYGAWALVTQEMTNTVVGTFILVITTRIHVKLKISLVRLKILFGYGWKILISSVIATIYTEINPIIIGLKFTNADLSFYTKGRSFPKLASTATTNTLQAVLFPVLSKFQDDKKALLNYTRRFIRVVSFIAFPFMLGFYAIADNFVEVILTEKWMQIVPYIRIFCIVFMFDMIHIGNCEVIKAMGRSDMYLYIEIIKKSLYFLTIGLFLAFCKSPIELAFSSIVCTFIAIIVNSIPNRKLLGYSGKHQFFDLLPNLITSLIMCVVVCFIGTFEINAFLLLCIQIIIGVFTYLLANIIIKNDTMFYLIAFIKENIT